MPALRGRILTLTGGGVGDGQRTPSLIHLLLGGVFVGGIVEYIHPRQREFGSDPNEQFMRCRFQQVAEINLTRNERANALDTPSVEPVAYKGFVYKGVACILMNEAGPLGSA